MRFPSIRGLSAFTLVFATLTLTACTNNPEKQRSPYWQFSTIDGVLWAQASDGHRFELPVKGQRYYPTPSPDGHWLALEIQRLSNLRTLRIFEHTASGFTETPVNASTYLWNLASKQDGIDTANIRNPAIRTIGWHRDAKILEVELRGDTADGDRYQRVFQLVIANLQP